MQVQHAMDFDLTCKAPYCPLTQIALAGSNAMNLKQLSEILGLSQTTVSRALNGYPEVAERTRLRVQHAAQKHNYQPNIGAQRLARGRSMTIGHVIPLSTQHEMVNPVFADFIAGAGERYSACGYDMKLTIVDDQNEEDIYRDLKSRGSVDGIIVHGPLMNDPRIPLLQELDLPFVVHGRASDIETPYCWVDVNNASAFQRAGEFLLSLGHRRIGLINGLEHMDFAHRRRAGLVAALEAAGITPNPDYLHAGEMTEINGHNAMKAMLALDTPPTAVVVASFIAALGVRRALDEAGLRMARDVSVITFDDDLSYLRNGDSIPIFTATRSSVRQAGRLSADLLISHIENPTAAPEHKLLEADLIIGNSTGPVPQE